MKLEGDYLFQAPVEEVWKALFDPVVLAAVMPGCEKLERVNGQYQGDLNIKVGPIQGKFSGKVDLEDMDEPRGYTMRVEGRGAPGFVKAKAAVKLEREGEATRLRYAADAQVGGKIASVGQRLLEASARAISKQSLEGLDQNIKLRVAAARPPDVSSAGPEESTAFPGGPKSGSEAAIEEAAWAAEAAPSRSVAVERLDQTALAASVAREVVRSLLPRPVLIAMAIGVVLLVGWFVVVR